jgi:hypothetical protein
MVSRGRRAMAALVVGTGSDVAELGEAVDACSIILAGTQNVHG